MNGLGLIKELDDLISFFYVLDIS